MQETETESEPILWYPRYLTELSAKRLFSDCPREELGIHAGLTEDEIILLAKRLDWQVFLNHRGRMVLTDTERFVRESVYYLRYHKVNLRRQARQYDQRVNGTLRYLRKNDPRLKTVTFESLHAAFNPASALDCMPFVLYRYDTQNWYMGDAQQKPGAPRLWGWVRHVEGDGHQPYQGGLLTDPTWRVAADAIESVAYELTLEHAKRRGSLRTATRVWQVNPPALSIQVDRNAPRNTYAPVCPQLVVSAETGIAHCDTGDCFIDALMGVSRWWGLVQGAWPEDIYRLTNELEVLLRALLEESGSGYAGETKVGWLTTKGKQIDKQIGARVDAWCATFRSAEDYFADRVHELRLHPWLTDAAITELAYRLEDECEAQGVHVRGTEAWIRKHVEKWRKLRATS